MRLIIQESTMLVEKQKGLFVGFPEKWAILKLIQLAVEVLPILGSM